MAFRSALCIPALFLCVTAFSQSPSQSPDQAPEPIQSQNQSQDQTAPQSTSNLPRSFHDPLLNITYFYPARFVPAAAATAPEAGPQCVKSNLSASSITPVDTSVFVLSTIDSTCPAVLSGAARLGPFVREQLLRQLKRYGDPVIIQDSTHYTIDGHPAVIAVASAKPASEPAVNGATPVKTTFAAKACFLGNIPVKAHKKNEPVDPPKHVFCFDFTTQQQTLLSLMFSFSMQFDADSPQPLVPGSALR
jgi:hypothetical protein